MNTMRTILLLAAMLSMTACSSLIGVFVRVGRAGGTRIHVGETLRGSTASDYDVRSPACVGNGDAPDALYVFEAPEPGRYQFAVDADYDCAVAVYDDRDEVLACNDDADGTNHSRVEANLDAGRRYLIVVTGYESNRGAYSVTARRAPEQAPNQTPAQTPEEAQVLPRAPMGPPPIERATPITLGQSIAGSTLTGEDLVAAGCGARSSARDVLYVFDAPSTGAYRIAVDASYDSVVAVYADAEMFACNDDSGNATRSVVDVNLEASRRYVIAVTGFGQNEGTFTVSVQAIPQPVITPARTQLPDEPAQE